MMAANPFMWVNLRGNKLTSAGVDVSFSSEGFVIRDPAVSNATSTTNGSANTE